MKVNEFKEILENNFIDFDMVCSNTIIIYGNDNIGGGLTVNGVFDLYFVPNSQVIFQGGFFYVVLNGEEMFRIKTKHITSLEYFL